MRVIVSRNAAAYLRHERQYLSRFDPRAAEAAMLQIREAIRTLSTFPGAGSVALPLPGRRRFVAGAYVLDYRISATAVVIVAIRHGRQHDPAIPLKDDEFEAPDDR